LCGTPLNTLKNLKTPYGKLSGGSFYIHRNHHHIKRKRDREGKKEKCPAQLFTSCPQLSTGSFRLKRKNGMETERKRKTKSLTLSILS
jgi:hypothetical protein